MSYLSLYRKFRPQTFDKVIGQSHITQTLINQIKSDKIGHAYLFCGTRGTGKTTTAKIFAKAINCLNPKNGSPCGECENCLALSSGSPDVFEIDAASNNKVENVREIRDKVQYPPISGKYKVYIIDEVHMLTGEAFNALLKTLEEPPKHAVFILATTEVYKIPSTILSRCMRFDFRLIPIKELVELVKGIFDSLGRTYEEDAIYFIAKNGEGCARDVLSIAEICASFTDGEITLKSVKEVLGATDEHRLLNLLEYMLSSNSGEALKELDELITLGKSVGMIFKDLIYGIREMLTVSSTSDNFLGLTSEKLERYKQLLKITTNKNLLRIMEILSLAEGEIRYSSHPRIVLETALIKSSLPTQDTSTSALTARVAELEKKLENLQNPTVQFYASKSQVETIVDKPKIISQEVNAFEPVVQETKNVKPLVQEVKPVEEKKVKRNVFAEEQVAIPEDVFSVKQEVPQQSGSANSTFNVNSAVREDSKKVWGAILRKIRLESMTLFAICSERITEIKGDSLCIYADGESDFMLLSKQDNLSKIQKATLQVENLKVKICEKSSEYILEEQAEKDVLEVQKIFGDKVKVNKEN